MENRYPSTIVPRVVAALLADVTADFDLVQEEHPGYIAIVTDDGTGYATGTANDTWTIDALDATGSANYRIDTDIPTTENDATVIAAAIIAAIQEDQAC